MARGKARAVTAALAALSVVLCGATKCTDTPSSPSRGGKVPPPAVAAHSKTIEVYGSWNTVPPRHHDIELTITYGSDVRHPTELVIPWEHGGYGPEMYTLRAGDTISVTLDQQESGPLNCSLQDMSAGHTHLGNSPQSRFNHGSITCRYTLGLYPAGWHR